MRREPARNANRAKGLSLVELLIAIGILGVTMMLIGAAFPAGVAMSIAVSDETTAQAVFQEALSVIRDNYSLADGAGPPGTAQYDVVADLYLGRDEDGNYDEQDSPGIGLANRQYEIAGQPSTFSWSVLMRRMGAAGPMGNLCQVVVVVSRRPSGSPNFINDGGGDSELPELRSVTCTASDEAARTLDIASTMVPNGGYIIDETTGTAYIIVSRNNNDTVTLLTEPPSGVTGNFWVVPGEYDSVNDEYGRKSPAIRVFQAMLYLP